MSNFFRTIYNYFLLLFTYEPASSPANDGKPWSAADIKDLTALSEANMSTADLAALFERTPGAIYQKLQQIKRQSK